MSLLPHGGPRVPAPHRLTLRDLGRPVGGPQHLRVLVDETEETRPVWTGPCAPRVQTLKLKPQDLGTSLCLQGGLPRGP